MRCVRRKSAFWRSASTTFDVEQFVPAILVSFSLDQGVRTSGMTLRGATNTLIGPCKALEITDALPRCAGILQCARIWVALTFEDSLPRALAAMDHAEAFYFADLVVPTETDARTERRRLESLQDGHEAICKEWLRSFGPDFGARCLRQFQERGFALTAAAQMALSRSSLTSMTWALTAYVSGVFTGAKIANELFHFA